MELGAAMRYFTVFAFLCVVSLLSSALFAQSIPSSSTIPVSIYRDYLIIAQGTIGGLEKRNVIIDTGAYPSVVSPEIAKKLHLSGYVEELGAVEHNIHSAVVSLPSLQLGSVRSEHLRVIVRDLTEFDRRLGIHVDALVGLDALYPNSFRIDYRGKKIILGPVDTLAFALPIQWRNSTACIDINVNDRAAHLLLDTGAADIMLFGQRLTHIAHESGDNVASMNLGGAFTLRQILLKHLEAGGSDLGPRDVYLSDAKNMDRYPYDGLMATAGFRFRQVAFDFDRQLFSWEPIRRKKLPKTTLMAGHPGSPEPSLAMSPSSVNGEATRPGSLCGTNPLGNDVICTVPTFDLQGSTR